MCGGHHGATPRAPRGMVERGWGVSTSITCCQAARFWEDGRPRRDRGDIWRRLVHPPRRLRSDREHIRESPEALLVGPRSRDSACKATSRDGSGRSRRRASCWSSDATGPRWQAAPARSAASIYLTAHEDQWLFVPHRAGATPRLRQGDRESTGRAATKERPPASPRRRSRLP